MDNSLPCFARRREWITQRVLYLGGVDTITKLVKGLTDGEITISQLLKGRGIGRKWVAEFAAAYPAIQPAIERYHIHCPPSQRIDYKGPQPDYRAD